MIATIGTSCAVIGSGISVIGNLVNTVYKDHHRAIELWTFSSAMVFVWGCGYLLGWWDGGIGVAAITGMNAVFLVSNLWGLVHT
jgi:hypothetical protein